MLQLSLFLLSISAPADGGWEPYLETSGQTQFVHNDHVVGRENGTSYTLGGTIDGRLAYHLGRHQFSAELFIEEAFSKTPQISEVLKTSDRIEQKNEYRYRLFDSPPFGFYAKTLWKSSLFKGKDVQESITTYQITRTDGSIEDIQARSLTLTKSFKPSTFTESAGVFVSPLLHEQVSSDFIFGGAAKQTLAADQLVVNDDAATAERDIVETRNRYQFGLEAAANILWQASENINLSATAKHFLPVIKGNPSGDNRNSLELLEQSYEAKLQVKLLEWLRFRYQFLALKQPEIIQDFQVSNGIFFDFSHLFFGEKKSL